MLTPIEEILPNQGAVCDREARDNGFCRDQYGHFVGLACQWRFAVQLDLGSKQVSLLRNDLLYPKAV